MFNGIIYNFKEIKKELEDVGVKFETSSDTEVIYESYINWGFEKTINIIKGMFSFAIIDLPKKEIYLCVDKIALKPLSYFYKNNELVFSSEIKSIIPFIEKLNFNSYQIKKDLFFGKHFDEDHIFEDIKKVEQGSYIKFNFEKNTFENIKYFKIENIVNKDKFKNINSNKNIIELYDKVFTETIKKHCQSDVPVGIMYSGGIDSALVAYKSKQFIEGKIPLFFYESKDYSHYPYAKLINKEKKFELIRIKDENIDFLKQLVDFAYYFENPNKSEALALSKVSEKAHNSGVKVLLAGDGADEIFGGYEFHNDFFQRNLFYNSKKFLLTNKFFRKYTSLNFFNFSEINPTTDSYLFQPLNFFNLEFLFNIVLNKTYALSDWKESLNLYKFVNNKFENENLSFIFYTFKNRIHLYNHRTDRVGMSNSVEIRVPFLYEDFLSLALNTKLKYKIKKNFILPNNQKYIIKLLAKKNNVPNRIIKRNKVGTELNLNPILENLIKNLDLKFCEEIFKIKQSDIKYNLLQSGNIQKYTYQFSIVIIELFCRLFKEKKSKELLYQELKNAYKSTKS